jgi:hypothetical protein
MDERFIQGAIGGLIGFSGAILLSIVSRLREDERSRKETGVWLLILKGEIEKRRDILNNKFADFDSEYWGDAVKEINSAIGYGGVTFNYKQELAHYENVFSSIKAKPTIIPNEILVHVWHHYTEMEEQMIAHSNHMESSNKSLESAREIRAQLRDEVTKLLELIAKLQKSHQPRNFVKWIFLWTFGKA